MVSSDIEILVADTPAARLLHYRLRYQVFCLETGFEDAAKFHDGQEKDEFDEHSVPFLVRSKRSGTWIATARLILPREDRVPPIERYCSLSRQLVSFDQIAELSRLLIVPQVRRRRQRANVSRKRQSTLPTLSFLRHRELSCTRQILSELIRAMSAYGLECGISHAAFFITPALARILIHMNIQLTKIGAPVEHRGIRFPYLSEAKQVYQALSDPEPHPRVNGFRRNPYRLYSSVETSMNSPTVRGQQYGT